MSDKHGGGGVQQWQTQATKATAAAAATAASTVQNDGFTGLLPPPPNAFYGGGLDTGTPILPAAAAAAAAAAAYASARFQAPHIHAPPPLSHSHPPRPHLEVTASNVPVPSVGGGGGGGFVPFPHNPAAATVGATSVLTANPYATNSISGGNSFGLDRFHHLNPQQQFDLSKLMNAIGSAPLLPNATNNTIQTPPAPPVPPTPLVAAPIHSPAATSATSSGVITTTIAENVLNAIGAGGSGSNAVNANATTATHGRLISSLCAKALPATADDDKMRRIQHVVESGIGDQAKQQILQILDRISTLRPVEKLLLYLRLPGEAPETDPLRHPQNPLGTRSEINHTINWVRSHLEHDPQVSIPKQDVYNDYIAYCERLDIKPLSTADFGKVMKQVFPGIRPRRLGTRGHSRYCYAAMRKTTKLTAPQLPHIGSAATAESGGVGVDSNISSSSSIDLNVSSTASSALKQQQQHCAVFATDATDDAESWGIVKTWAESLLNVRIDSVRELASHIKNNSNIGPIISPGAAGAGATRTNAAQKKYTQREPKEKRLLADTGPLKKRRKKKRKGSSSSESSCNQLQSTTTNNTSGSADLTNTSGTSAVYTAPSVGGVTSEDEPKSSIKMIKVKQEIIESPNFQRVQHLPAVQMPQTAALGGEFVQQQPQPQHQLLPMNLATEQRTVDVLIKAPMASAFGGVPRTSFAAAKNLTPKILEMSATAAAAAAAQTEQMHIKEEVVDDYNPTVILCKKVRKAQQTKGFWTNSPTPPATSNSGNGGSNSSAASSSSLVVPIITTTAASPPPPPPPTTGSSSTSTIVISSSSSSVPIAVLPVSNYLMGPPAQIAASTSPSAMSLLDASGGSGNVTPKVASRNMLLLRAKKQQVADVTPPPDADAADLPENLGLPRERVISICNMDKHELDDYFLPSECGEDEDDDADSQDQDTELLQYFQTGDAEEKLNSLDAAKLRNPSAMATQKQTTSITTITTTAQTPPITTTMTMTTATMMTIGGRENVGMQEMKAENQMLPTTMEVKRRVELQSTLASTTATTTTSSSASSSSSSSFAAIVSSATATAPAVSASAALGSASASLTLMSQKHQQNQNQHHQQQHQQQQQPNNKRKISATFNHDYSENGGTTDQDHPYMMTPAARKNCIFLPISPNINTTSSSSLSTTSGGGINSNVPAFFASPGLTRLRPKPALSKQQSLDSSDSSDPMIGASRRRRSYVATMSGGAGGGNATTSASAPPSPSPMQQQQQQSFYGTPSSLLLVNQWAPLSSVVGGVIGGYSDNSAADQNSLDLDLFSAAAASNTNYQNAAHNQQQQQNNNNNNQAFVIDSDLHFMPLSETQRSQSVPLSQLQRIHSPAFSRSFQTSSNYSGCASMAPTPVPHDFTDSTMLFSENSSSQHSLGGINTNSNNQTLSAAIKMEDDSAACVFAADSTVGILDEVDVSEILSSPDFVAKFSSIAPTNTATTTCSSSAGSSSGYSSSTGACTAFGIMGDIMGSGGGGGGIVSRSVPSTPLPYHHHNANIFSNTVGGGGGSFYGKRNAAGEDLIGGGGGGKANQFSSTTAPTVASAFAMKYDNCGHGGRNPYDISKSMPTTPITSHGFRYSPTATEFLTHSNTIDSLICGGGSADVAGDDGLAASVVLDVFGSNASDSSMVGVDIIGNL